MTTPTMQAVRIHGFGGPDVLRVDEIPVPEPGPGEVRVSVHAVGVNPPDWYMREGMPGVPEDLLPPFALPMTLGTDASGVVDAVGPGVEGLAPGDEVFGLLRFPTSFQGSAYAEHVVAPAEDLARKPAGVSHAHAAAVAMAGLTAWQFLIALGHDHPSPFQDHPHRPVPLGPGVTVLVNGAAGGVGHLAVGLAKWRGARVVAVASGRHEAFLRDLGADEVVDYTAVDPADVVSEVDLVVDTVGGPATRRFLRVLRRGGALFPVYLAEYDPREVAELGVVTSSTQVRSSGRQLEEIAALLEAGTLRVAIDRTFALEDARAAHEHAARGHLQGKIVLQVA
jgi:NADPH:quinone reductase-like Zn-dependent oxidoreductase